MKRIEFKYRIELITRNRELIEGACLKYKCLKVDNEILVIRQCLISQHTFGHLNNC